MKHLYTLAFICLAAKSYSQEGFGTSNPNPNSVIELKAADKGLLMPRVALTSTDSAAPLAAHVQGMTVYNTVNSGSGTTAVTEGFYYNDGTQWIKANNKEADLRLVSPNNHITIDAGVGSNGTNAGTGPDNIAIGRNSLSQIINGDNNIAIGNSALTQNTTGFENTAFGSFTLSSNDSGVQNTAFGTASLLNNTTGFANTAIGFRTLEHAINGTYNVGIGYFAGSNLISGLHNIFIGHDAQPNVSVNGDEQLNIGNWIFGDNGKIGIGADAIIPSERLDISNGNVRIRDINTNTGVNTDNLVVADANGVLKTLAPSTLIVEPWQIQTTTDKATSNSDNIYQSGSVAIGKNEVLSGALLDVAGALRVGSGHTGTVGGNSAAFGTDVTVSGGNSVGIGNQNTVWSSNTLVVGTSNTAMGTGTANAIFGSNNIQTTEGGGPAYNNNTIFGNTNKITTEGGGGAVQNNTLFGQNNLMTAAGGGSNQANNTIFGQNNTLSAEGSGTTQLNNTIFGNNNRARISANNSTIFGENNISNSYNQFIIGKANTNLDNSLFEIGMGADASNRANALTVIANGNVGIANEATTPTEKLDVGSGNVRVRDINTNTGADTDNIVVADSNGVLKTVPSNTYQADVRVVGTSNHISQDAGVGSNGTSAGSGFANILIGLNSGTSLSGGIENIALGEKALNQMTTGGNNIALGQNAMFNHMDSSQNIALGVGALTGLPGTNSNLNIAIGSDVLSYSQGEGNTGVGFHSLLYNGTGNYNLGLGYEAGSGIFATKNITTGSRNTAIGFRASVPVGTADNQLSIGNLIYGTGLDGTFGTVSTGNIGIGQKDPSERLDINGRLRVRTLDSGTSTDNIVVADGTGVIKTIPRSSLTSTNIYNSDGILNSDRDVDTKGQSLRFSNSLSPGTMFYLAAQDSQTNIAVQNNTRARLALLAGTAGITAIQDVNGAAEILSTGSTTKMNIGTTASNAPVNLVSNGNVVLTGTSNGNVGIGVLLPSVPTNSLHVKSASNPVRFEGLQTGATTDNIVVADTNGVLKTVAPSTLVVEPWQIATTTNKATANTDNIYQMGKIGVGTSTPNSTLQVTGSQSASIRTVSTNFTITDTDYTLVLDAPTTDVTYTANIPAPDSTNIGRIYHIALSSTNNIQFTGAGGSMVYQGAYTRDILYYYQISSITIQSNGSKWVVLQ